MSDAAEETTAAIGELRLLDELAASAAEAGALRDAFAYLLHAAAENPVLLARVRHDPLLAAVTERFDELLVELEARARKGWEAGHEAAVQALTHAEPWTLLADHETNERFRALEQRLAVAAESASRGDPFAHIEATEAIEAVPADANALSLEARNEVTATQRAAVTRLDDTVQSSSVELRASQEWVDAAQSVQDAHRGLEGIDELEDAAARDALEQIRHAAAVHVEMLEVTQLEMTRRERARSEKRQYKQAEDRAVLFTMAERQKVIHLQFVGTVVIALALVWLGPAVVVAATPAIFALWRAAESRAIVRQRVWSLARSEVDPVAEALGTRMIIAALLILAVGFEAAILWMRDQLPY